MQLGIKNNLKEVTRGLNDVSRRQIPFATAMAINEVLGDIKKNSDKRLRRVIDRPTPFTMKAYAIRRANKRTLTGMVFAKRIQAQYLQWLEDGGNRGPKRRAIPVPVKHRLNKYGNVSRGGIGRTIAKPATFSGAPTGRPGAAGIYQRMGKGGGKLKLLISFADRASYKPRLGFKTGARRTAMARLPGAMYRAMMRAVSSAR